MSRGTRRKKSLPIRTLEAATGTIALATLALFASVIGVNAYLLYQPAALEAQAGAIELSAQQAPVGSGSESSACQQAKAAAAARGHGDGESSIINDQSDANFQDQCVAAVLNPAGVDLNPADPNSYVCVGKSAKVNVNAAGLISDTATLTRRFLRAPVPRLSPVLHTTPATKAIVSRQKI